MCQVQLQSNPQADNEIISSTNQRHGKKSFATMKKIRRRDPSTGEEYETYQMMAFPIIIVSKHNPDSAANNDGPMKTIRDASTGEIFQCPRFVGSS